MSPRGPKPGSGKTGGAAVGKLGGRPPQSATLKLGARIAVQHRTQDGVLPLEPGVISQIKRGDPRVITVTLDSGDTLVLFV